MTMRLSLHTWTLDTTPLADALVVIKKTGWDAVELRRRRDDLHRRRVAVAMVGRLLAAAPEPAAGHTRRERRRRRPVHATFDLSASPARNSADDTT